MAIEPKKLLQENIPLVASYAAALVAIIVYVVVVMPMSSTQLKKKTKKLKNISRSLNELEKMVDEKTLLTVKDKEAASKRKEILKSRVKSLADLYIAEDKKLEVWFPELKLKYMSTKEGQHPPAGTFKELYKSKFLKLVQKYKDIVQPEGVEQPRLVYEDLAAAPKDRITAQKRFWYKEDILNSFKKSGVKELLTDISSTSIDPPAPTNPNDGSEPQSAQPYKETEFTFSVKVPFSKLSVLLRNLLAGKFTYKLRNVSVRRTEFSYKMDAPGKMSINDIAKSKHFGSATYTITFPESVSEFSKSETDVIPEPEVIATIIIRALDFEVKPIKEEGGDEGDE